MTESQVIDAFHLKKAAQSKWEYLQAAGAEQVGIVYRMNGEGGTINAGTLGILDQFGRVEWVELGEAGLAGRD